MRSVVTLALLILVAAIALGAPESHATLAASAPLDLRGIALLTITVIVIAVEGVRRLP